MVYGAHAEPQPRTLVECPDGSRPHTHSRPHTQAVEGRWVIGYALHDARENDGVPDARVCNHACGHGGFCDLRTGLGPILITGAIAPQAAGVVGAGVVARRAAGATATPRSAITGDHPIAIFYLRSLASAAIVQHQPSITRRRRRRVNWKRRRAKQ